MIDVVVPVYNDTRGLEIVLRMFRAHRKFMYPFKIHVVCDGGDKETAEAVAKRRGAHTFSYLGPAKGPNDPGRMAAARNMGLKLCDSERVLFVDGDCVPSEDVIPVHMDARGVLIGQRLEVNQEDAESVRNNGPLEYEKAGPDIRRVWQGQPGEFAWLYNKGLNEPLTDGAEAIAWTCHISYPTKLVRAIGGFWEKFVGWSFEDNDLALRVIRAGEKVRTTTVPVYHLSHPKQPVATRNHDLFVQSKYMKGIVRNAGPI